MDDQRGLVRVEACSKRIRVVFAGHVIADTTHALYVWERPQYPQYYIPTADVADGALHPTATVTRSPSRGAARHFTVRAGARAAVDAAWMHDDSPLEAIRNHVRFDWAAMDAWFEEDVEVFVHPRNPYTRVDALASSRHVRVDVGGVTVADTTQPVFLFETGVRRRTYVRKTDVRMDLLVPTATVTMCPYKGTACYWSVITPAGDEEDIAWSYPTPLPEAAAVADLVAFYDERADLYVDGTRVTAT